MTLCGPTTTQPAGASDKPTRGVRYAVAALPCATHYCLLPSQLPCSPGACCHTHHCLLPDRMAWNELSRMTAGRTKRRPAALARSSTVLKMRLSSCGMD